MATRSERIAIVKENNRKIIIDSILEESRNVEGKLNDRRRLLRRKNRQGKKGIERIKNIILKKERKQG